MDLKWRQSSNRLRTAMPEALSIPRRSAAKRFCRSHLLPRLSRRQCVEGAALLAVLAVAAWFTGHNMLHYPQYELDEGTYVGSAWSMFAKGTLFYYTYTYAHPPLGWFQIGLWAELTGGFDAFGLSINSGRVFMLLLTLLSTGLIFLIVRRGTTSAPAAAIGALAFAISPLSVTLHRQVYLDNIGTFWLLVAIYALLRADGRLNWILGSALAFGIAFWSKEVFIAFLPGLLYLVVTMTHPGQRRFSAVLWATVALAAVSLFVLLAILNDELLPPGVLWSSSAPHVSLIKTYFSQADRGGGGILDPHGNFWHNVYLWRINDQILVVGGFVACLIGPLLFRRNRLIVGTSLMALSFILFLGRGGIVIYYYVIPLLAVAAIAIGLLVGSVFCVVAPHWRPIRVAILPVSLVAMLLLGQNAISRNSVNFNVNDTASQLDAAQWMVRNIPRSSVVIMDSYAWQDLRSQSFTEGQPFDSANYYWPTLSDPNLRETLLHNTWQKIDYLMVSPNTEADIAKGTLPLLPEALQRADVIHTFSTGTWSQQVLRVRKLHQMQAPEDPILARTWDAYKAQFIINGQVIDPKQHQTTSEGQAYALLRAVYMNDRVTFDQVWKWTQDHLQVRSDRLLAWKWGAGPDGVPRVLDQNTATDADEDAALALLFASRTWGDAVYERSGLEMIDAIWSQETVVHLGQRVLVAGNWARGDGGGFDEPVLNPSYFAPYAYRIFAEADPAHRWMDVVDSSYKILEQIHDTPNLGGKAGLAPNWLKLDKDNGDLRLVGEQIQHANEFSYDASRLPWRLSIDYLWFHDERAKTAIQHLNFAQKTLKSGKRLRAAYQLDGTPAVDYEATSMYAGIVPSLLVTDDPNLDLAHQVFAQKILSAYHDGPDFAYWGDDANDYYTQNLAWFTCAIMDGAISNLWAGQTVIDWKSVITQAS